MYSECAQRRFSKTNFSRPGDSKFCLSCQHRLMVQLGCRPWNLSLISVIVLVLSNMLLTFLLLQSETCAPYSLPKESESNIVTDWNLQSLQEEDPPEKPCILPDDPPKEEVFLKLDLKLGRWDSRRLYKTFDAVFVGDKFSDLSQTSKVCLATQTSIEKLHSLVQVVHHWSGPLSVALFVAGDEEFDVLQRYLVYFNKCYAPIRNRVVFSLAMPKNRLPKRQPSVFEMPEAVDCAKPEATLTALMSRVSNEQTNWRIRNVYPQNHMRNLARKNCQTQYVFLTDVDIVPSFNLTGTLEEFLKGDNCEKCAYVIPTYELDSRVRFPQNKSELVRLAKKGLARPFHQKVFIHNQFATNFTRVVLSSSGSLMTCFRWVMDLMPGHKGYENMKNGKIYVSHEVTNFEFLYEPFYIAKDIAPAHDERFMGYGYTRNTQVYEMYVAGYKFKVLSPVFTVHWGLQTRRSRPGWRERQNSANRKQFEVFKKEILARYMRDPLKMVKNLH